jgi:transposase
MNYCFIGVDISKLWLDVAICPNLDQGVVENFQVSNCLKGIRSMIKRCQKLNLHLWFCFEHTGNYGLLLSHLLEAENLRYSAIPALEIKRSIGITRGKNDQIDACRIAVYGATHKHKLTETKIGSKVLLRIKTLLAYREQLSKQSRQWQNALKSYQVSSEVTDLKDVMRDTKALITQLKKRIEKVDKQIEEAIRSEKHLEKNYRQAGTVKGVGPLIAAYFLVYTNNFTSFDNPRKFNCFAGLAPFTHTSGTSIRGKTRTSNLRNKKMKALLFKGAFSASRSDSELRRYYIRKLEEGKSHLCVINAIACKLVYRIFAVINRTTPYVPLVR